MHLANIVSGQAIKRLKSLRDSQGHIGCAISVHWCNFFPKVSEDIMLVKLLENYKQNRHVDREKQENDQQELKHDLRT